MMLSTDGVISEHPLKFIWESSSWALVELVCHKTIRSVSRFRFLIGFFYTLGNHNCTKNQIHRVLRINGF